MCYVNESLKLMPLGLVDLFLKNQYNTIKSGLKKKTDENDKKIPDTNGLVKKTDYNAKITEI